MMHELNPNAIPEVIALVGEIYSSKRTATNEENLKIVKFFSNFMAGAIDECMDGSMKHHMFARSVDDIAFNTKEVSFDTTQDGGKVSFIVATTANHITSKNDFDVFSIGSQKSVVDKWADFNTENWVMVFNRQSFNIKEKTFVKRQLVSSLFLGIRFSENMFLAKEA